MNIVVALLIFTIIVVIHELGHFIFAKKNGVGVPEFSVGMGPRLITVAKTSKGMKVKFLCSQKAYDADEDWQDVTKYSWKLLPIGGSCAMVGEDEDVYSEDSFNTKGKWARFTIVFAGPFFNFILAFVLSIIIIAQSGIDYPEVFAAYDNQPAKMAGIEEGDIIKSINGHKITIGREVETYMQLHPLDGSDVTVVVERDGKEKTFTFSPKYKTNLFGFSYSAEENHSAKISALSEDKPFEKAGVKAGDEIVSVNGEPVNNGAELKTIMEKYNDGKEVTFEIRRGDTVKEYKIAPVAYETNTLGVFAEAREKTGNAFQVIKYIVVEV
ncbi:MAG: site-2 protease family protein [Lachnospiraceae bacterium]|nr:site-2 protease family protein [Lachnospiraceae bacterium]